MKKLFLILLSLISLLYYSQALYIHLKQNEEKCFYDEFYSEIVVMVRFKIMNRDITLSSEDDKRLEISIVSESDDQVIYKYNSGKMNGKFSTHIERTGNYKICLYSDDADYFNKRNVIKVSLIVDTDQEEISVDKSVSQKHIEFKAVDGSVRKLFQRATDIALMQEYQLKREDDFSEHQFENSHRMVYITIIQVVIISVIGLCQIFALNRIFKEKVWSPF